MNPGSCLQFEEYLSGLLTKEEHAAFQLHLASCTTCQKIEAQTLAIEETIRKIDSRISPRPVWMEHMESMLRRSMKGLEQVDETSIQTFKKQRNWLPTAVSISVLAALILLVLSLSNKTEDKYPLVANITQDEFEPFEPNNLSESRPMSVRATSGFLCARVECDDPDIEFYVVLPSAN